MDVISLINEISKHKIYQEKKNEMEREIKKLIPFFLLYANKKIKWICTYREVRVLEFRVEKFSTNYNIWWKYPFTWKAISDRYSFNVSYETRFDKEMQAIRRGWVHAIFEKPARSKYCGTYKHKEEGKETWVKFDISRDYNVQHCVDTWRMYFWIEILVCIEIC